MNPQTLPSDYRRVLTLTFQKRSHFAQTVHVLAAAAAVLFLVAGLLVRPPGAALAGFNRSRAWLLLLQPVWIALGIGVCTGLRLGLDALLVRLVAKAKPVFTFSRWDISVRGDMPPVDKRAFIALTLGPSALLFLLLVILSTVLPGAWFWTVYLLLIFNVTGLAGDIYVAYLACRMSADLLVLDRGTERHFYTRQNETIWLPDFEYIPKICNTIQSVLAAAFRQLKKYARKAKKRLSVLIKKARLQKTSKGKGMGNQ